ncbi:MAG: MscL family protein [Candidatus Saccharimonadales bacterium]
MAERKRISKPNSARLATRGSSLRMQQASSTRKPKPRVASRVAHEINPVGGFVTFLREHAVISLAVGFAIATQAQAVIKQLITSFIDPLYGLLLNGQKLSARVTTAHFHGRAQQFAWGAFVYALIDFLFVLAFIYAIIKIFNLDKLDTPKKRK